MSRARPLQGSSTAWTERHCGRTFCTGRFLSTLMLEWAAYGTGMDSAVESRARDRPYVVLHVAVTLDGSTAGFAPDVGRFYELAAVWHEDVTVAGADTILAQESALAAAELPGPAPDGPTLAVIDGRGRISAWQSLRDAGYWSDVVAVHSATTPPRRHGLPEIVTGSDRVDLGAMLQALHGRCTGATVPAWRGWTAVAHSTVLCSTPGWSTRSACWSTRPSRRPPTGAHGMAADPPLRAR